MSEVRPDQDDLDAVDIVAYRFHQATLRQAEAIRAQHAWIQGCHVQRGVEVTAVHNAAHVAGLNNRPILAWFLYRFYEQLRAAPLPPETSEDE